MSDDDKTILTPEEAESLLAEGDTVHNYANPGPGMMVGCDYERADAIAAIKAASLLEIGGPGCKAMRHALVVHDKNGRYTFFETDAAKVAAMEDAKAMPVASSEH